MICLVLEITIIEHLSNNFSEYFRHLIKSGPFDSSFESLPSLSASILNVSAIDVEWFCEIGLIFIDNKVNGVSQKKYQTVFKWILAI